MPNPMSVVPTAAVADACIAVGVEVRMAPPSLVPLLPPRPVAGRAVAVHHVGSVDVFLEAFGGAGSGDVLVIDNDGRDDEGCIGDLTAIEAQGAGISCAVIWGRHRDADELRRLGFQVYSRGALPVGPRRASVGRGGLGIARLDGVEVRNGDAVFADGDGVVFVSAEHRERVVAAAQEIVTRERRQAVLAREGTSLRSQFRFDEYLARRAKDASYTFREHLRGIRKEIEV